jgi:hypothetical protein
MARDSRSDEHTGKPPMTTSHFELAAGAAWARPDRPTGSGGAVLARLRDFIAEQRRRRREAARRRTMTGLPRHLLAEIGHPVWDGLVARPGERPGLGPADRA